MLERTLWTLGARGLLAGGLAALAACAVTPLAPPPVTHPASPGAAEAPARPVANRLSDDAATRETETLLKAAADSSTMPGMTH